MFVLVANADHYLIVIHELMFQDDEYLLHNAKTKFVNLIAENVCFHQYFELLIYAITVMGLKIILYIPDYQNNTYDSDLLLCSKNVLLLKKTIQKRRIKAC